MIKEGIYDNRSTMQREVWWYDREKGEFYLASSVSASEICQRRTVTQKGIPSTWGTYPDIPTLRKEGDV
jgi:hypothetical protein